MADTIVIGAGLAGLVAAIRCARMGASVTLLTTGVGGIQLSQGTVDVLGYSPDRVTRPLEAAAEHAARHRDHPYAVIGVEAVREGVGYLAGLAGPELLVGDWDTNVQLPTAVGAVRPTCLVPPSMAAGHVSENKSFLVVGLRQLKDFYPQLVADNLTRNEVAPVTARALTLDFPAREGESDATGLTYARAFDRPEFRQKFAALLGPRLETGEIVLLPAVLGYRDPAAWHDLCDRLGHEVAEVPLPPPGVPGMRLNEALLATARQAGVRIVVGSKVVGFDAAGDRVTSVSTAAAGRRIPYQARSFVYAPGGFESGTLAMDSYGAIHETLFDLPLTGLEGDLVTGDYWADQRLFRVGVPVDAGMRPVTNDGAPVFENMRVVGGILAGATRWSEKSGEGIALGSAVKAADSLGGA